MNRNNVIFKAGVNGISIILDSEVSFEEIQVALLEKLKSAKSFFYDASMSITFKGRDLSEEEEIKLLDIISKESGLDISFVNKTKIGDENIEEKNTKQKIEPVYEGTNQNITNIVDTTNADTHFHKGAIRSGQKIEFAGSVVVVGDVNPGGQIIAEGNVIILGKLKGTVHAGCRGAISSFVSALNMMPSQLIIGDCIAYFPADLKREIVPEYAYVKDGQIFIEPLNT